MTCKKELREYVRWQLGLLVTLSIQKHAFTFHPYARWRRKNLLVQRALARATVFCMAKEEKDRKMNAMFFSDCTISKKEKCKEGGRSVFISLRSWPRKPSCKYFRLKTPQKRCLCKLSMNELRLNGLH